MKELEMWQAGITALRELKFCGCGNPESGYGALMDALKVHDTSHDTGERKKWAEKLGGSWDHNNGSGYDYLLLYFLDAAGLLEHGGSVGGSWLSEKGKNVLSVLEHWGTDPDEWPEEYEFK